MTEKLRSVLSDRGWEILMTALLTIIIGMGGWYLNRVTDILDRQDERIEKLQDNDIIMAYVMACDPNTKEADRIDLRNIYFNLRGWTK